MPRQRSSRQPEILCQENVAYRVLAADTSPDHYAFARFRRRGLSACQSEWAVICATHNLLKMFRSGKAAWN